MMSDADFAMPAQRSPVSHMDEAALLPLPPKSVRDTGLAQALLVELTAKIMHADGRIHLPVLTGKLRLSFNVLREVLGYMMAEQLVEVAGRGESDLDVYYQLTATGRLRACEYLARCRYAGAAPVTLDAYRDQLLRQSRRHGHAERIGAADMAAAFADDVFNADVRTQLGAALQSGRSVLLFGPSGSGKTTLARKLGSLLPGLVAVPHAVLVNHAIVQIYSPQLHLAPSAGQARQLDERRPIDSRWVLCQRPLVAVGAELSQAMLDLRHDQSGGLYHAPPHLAANNGILLIDDFGRQRVATSELLNRFIAPLDSGIDYLNMDGGQQLSVPFDVTLLFASNIAPHLLLDESAMRRVGYKIEVGALDEPTYRALFRRQCRATGVAHDEDVLDHLIGRLHRPACRPLLACYPADLLGRMVDFASFAGSAPRLTVAALEQAWISMFAGTSSGTPAPAQSPVPYFTACADPLLEKIS